MSEFTITVTYVVDARDRDEAVEIAKAVRNGIVVNAPIDHGYKLRHVETQTIEEV